MLVERPAAISTFSTSIDSFCPPDSTSRVTEFLPTVAFSTLAPARTSIPRFLKLLATTSEDSASSMGRMRGSASISHTLVPKALKMSANSLPTAPAPTTAIVLGAPSRKSASSELITSFRSSSRPICGIPLVRLPVASTIPFFAS